MLERAFVETADYRSLTQTQDFNFIVGRRGTGKTALFRKTTEHYRKAELSVVAEVPREHQMIEFQRLLAATAGDYRGLRATARLVWRNHLLFEALSIIRNHYRFNKTTSFSFLSDYFQRHRRFFVEQGTARCLAFVQHGLQICKSPAEVPARLAATFDTEKLQHAVRSALVDINKSIVIIYDGLDEGWLPELLPTGIIGGLAIAVSDLSDANTGIHTLLFIRDNIFRSLAEFDSDFARHIEGQTLRLHWDEDSLLHLVSQRLRVALDLTDIENNIKVWNRFAYKDLKDRDGFELCLKRTLYRPRDILVLLNDAYVTAQREGREAIVGDDIEKSATRISQNRLEDLLKEYHSVLPGLRHFVSLFRGRPTQDTFARVIKLLDEGAEHTDAGDWAAGDFALFDSGREIFSALYSVGFIGVRDPGTGRYTFCHDGSASTLGIVEDDRLTTVHPCYWKALDLHGEEPPEDVMVQINDDYEAKQTNEIADLRIKRLGEILGELPRVPLGRDGSKDFERWVHRAVTLMFGQKLANIQPKPAPGATQRRDLVATNMAPSGFWRRILEDYGTRQVLFEVKNFAEIGEDDFRQVLSYTSGEYGRFAIIVSRPESEVPTESEKNWLRVMYHEHERVIMILPARVLARCLSKLRSPRKHDYAEETLGKMMDQLIRSHLAIPLHKKYRKGR